MSPAEFRTCLRLRLGLEQPSIRTDVKCKCGAFPDPYGVHYLTCSAGSHLRTRHEMVLRGFHEMCSATGKLSEIRGLEDKLHGFTGPKGHKLVLDQTIADWQPDHADVAMDFAICHPCAPTYCAAASSTNLAAADRRSEQKHGKYGAACQAHDLEFQAPVLEVFGAMNKRAEKLIKRAARLLQDELPEGTTKTWTADTFASWHTQRISIALQRTNAKAIRLRAARDFRRAGFPGID